jgi:hypothetical protein
MTKEGSFEKVNKKIGRKNWKIMKNDTGVNSFTIINLQKL